MLSTVESHNAFNVKALTTRLLRNDWKRTLRLTSGLVLLAFVTMHLVNHALGLIGIAQMSVMQEWRWVIWKSRPGTWLLYGSFFVHVTFTLARILRRGTFRMPFKEALQLILGLSIPFLIIGHVAGTRLAGDMFGLDESYIAVLHRLWPKSAVIQTVAVLVVWFHGIIGFHYIFTAKRSVRTIMDDLLWAVAILVPALALAGFLVSGRDAQPYDGEPTIDPAVISLVNRTEFYGRLGAFGLLAAVGGVLGYREIGRRRRRIITVNYVGHGEVMVRPGQSLLEISRDQRIPHPSLCGGRGRCATCRVLVTKGLQDLPPIGVAERTLLEQIAAPPGVRLACQIHPFRDLSAQILLPVLGEHTHAAQSEHAGWGLEEQATVLVVDLRAFTNLVNTQVPYELVVLLNRFQEEMIQSVRAHHGHVDIVVVDGLTAVFKKDGHKDKGSRDALKAARDMFKSIEALNVQFQSALSLPLRIGVGIHTGRILTARIGAMQAQAVTLALGETVAVASKLEAASKDMMSDLVISRETALAAGLPIMQSRLRDIYVLGHENAISAYPIRGLGELAAVT